ncbi:filamentous hemagglutinin family outer membrane protein, partial [Rhodanobacter fulvus Jip2]
HVGDTTTLTGAAIASTADASKNRLDTGSLVVNDLHNSAHSSASQMGFSYSSNSSAASNLAGNAMGAALNMAIPQGGSDSSDTASSIAQGTIIVRNDPDQDLSSIDRSATTLDGNGVSNDFDVDKIKEKQALGQAAGYVGMRAAGDLADYMADHASTDQDQKSWGEGGTYRVLLHGLVGAATAELGGGNATQGALGAAASEAASGAMANYLADHHIDPNSAEGRTLMQLASAAVGGAVGGGAGAVTALDGEKYNRQLHETEKARIKALAGGDKQKEADLSTAACALVHCSAEYAKNSPEYAYYSQLEALGSQPQYADERALLQQQSITRTVVIQSGMSVPVTESLFGYGYGDKTSDYLSYVNNSYGHPFTRLGGGLQAVGGLGAAATGAAAVATGAAACPETLGGGCALAAGGVLLTGWGVDQTQAGVRTGWNGAATPTFGGQAIQNAFGISQGAAELLYGVAGGIGQVYTGISLLPAGTKVATIANADGTFTLAGDSRNLNSVGDFEQLAKGGSVTPTPGGFINQTKVCGSQCVLNVTDPADQALMAQIAQGGDLTGELTESLLNSVATKQGLTVLAGGKYAGNKGFDAVLQNADGSVTILIDAKQVTNGTFSLGKTVDGSLQLSGKWIDRVMGELDKTSPAYRAIDQARDGGTLNTAVIGVNKQTGQLIGVPVNIP